MCVCVLVGVIPWPCTRSSDQVPAHQIVLDSALTHFFFIDLFLHFCFILAAVGLPCCMQAFPCCDEWGSSLVAEHGL